MGLSDALADVWSQLAQGGAGFWLLVGGAGLALLSLLACPWLLLRGKTAAALAPLLATAVSVLGGVMVVERGRRMMIYAFRHPDPEAKVSGFAGGVTLQMNGLAAIGVIVSWMTVLAALLVAIPWALERRRQKQPIWPALATAIGLGGLMMVAVQGVLRWALNAIHVFASVAGVDPSMKTLLVRLGLVEANQGLDKLRPILIYAGIVAMAAMALRAVRAARRGEVVGGRVLILSALLFAVGGAAFARTRALAGDEPLTAEGENPFGADVRAPHVTRCGPGAVPVEQAAILSVGDELRLNGAKDQGMQRLGDDLVTLWNNHRLLHPNEPGGQPLLIVMADPKQPVLPFLQKWRALNSNYALRLVALVPKPAETRTLGRIERFESCAYPITFGPGRRPPATFGELATALNEQAFSVELP